MFLPVFLCGSSVSTSKNNRSFDTPVKGPPQGPRLHIDIPRVQLLIEDKEGIKQIGEKRAKRARRRAELLCVRWPNRLCSAVVKVKVDSLQVKIKPLYLWQTQSSTKLGTLRASAQVCLSTTPPSSRTPAPWLTCQTSDPGPVSAKFKARTQEAEDQAWLLQKCTLRMFMCIFRRVYLDVYSGSSSNYSNSCSQAFTQTVKAK